MRHLSSAVLARDLHADALVIATDADAVYADWGNRGQRAIAAAHPAEMAAFDVPAGSVGPRVDAAVHFATSTSKDAAIGALSDLPEILTGRAGTRISTTITGVSYR